MSLKTAERLVNLEKRIASLEAALAALNKVCFGFEKKIFELADEKARSEKKP